jgi:hypothetical protein
MAAAINLLAHTPLGSVNFDLFLHSIHDYYMLISTKSTLHGSANIVLKNWPMSRFFMETLSAGNSEGKNRVLLAELERHGVIPTADEALEVPVNTLERLLQEVKSKHNTTSNRSQNWFMNLYESMILDYITKLNVASVFLFSSNPLAALFWPPYYYYNNKRYQV